jgi:hypothetical protein
MAASDPIPAPARTASSRKLVFLLLQVLVGVEGVTFGAVGVLQFLAAAGGDPVPLLVSTILLLLAAALLYSAIALRSRGSTPFYAALVASVFGVLLLLSTGVALVWNVLPVAVVVGLVALRNRFHLRPGEVVKEEKLPPEIVAKLSTKVRGVRCKECGDDDVWITSDKLLVCKNCGTTNA